MAESEESFTLIEKSATFHRNHHLFDDVVRCNSAKSADHDLQYTVALRKANPDMIVTACPTNNVSLRAFAAAGFATCRVDTETDSYASWRGYLPPTRRLEDGMLAEAVWFAKYHYTWSNENFVLYTVNDVQYVLKECQENEHVLGPSKVTDALIKTIGDWVNNIAEVVWVYDRYWTQSRELWEEVQKASWDKVILDPHMKKELTTVAHKFFDSKSTYEDLGVPWKRGVLFHGPPGNGKTISIRALMNSLYKREKPVPTLYVKSAPYTYDIEEVFEKARALAPCMLILEDVETIVTPDTRSYFFNEMDGLNSNDGLFIVASTNFLDKLDPGLSKRPSRFDRKYLFPIPDTDERILYCQYWRQKLRSNKSIVFPEKLCPAMADITPGFSFAFLQECFVATLLALAREDDEHAFDSDNDDLDDYELWVTFKEQAHTLRKEIDNQKTKQSQLLEWCRNNEPSVEEPKQVPTPRYHFSSGSEKRAIATRGNEKDPMSSRMPPSLPWYNKKQIYMNAAAEELKP